MLKELGQYSLTLLLIVTVNNTAFTAGTTEDTVTEERIDWKTYVLTELDSKYYQNAFKRLLAVETDHADTSADWNNLMGYTMRMLDLPDLDASEYHYIKAVELKADHKGALEYYGELKLQQGDLEGAKKLRIRLAEVCTQGCDELDTLDQSIKTYEAKQK